MTRQTILLVDDLQDVREALGVLLEKPGRTTILCSDLPSAEIVLGRVPVTHLVTDVQLSGSFRYEGLHCIERVREANPHCAITLISGNMTDELRRTAMAMGANAVLSKPFDIDDLEAVLGDGEPSDPAAYEMLHVASLDDILRNGQLQTVFQPIVNVSGNAIFAFEALTRIRDGWGGGGPGELFDYAVRLGRVRDLNFRSIESALAAAAHLPAGASVFINVDPGAFTGELVSLVEITAARAGLDLSRVVLEATERTHFEDDKKRVRSIFSALRGLGIRFALDDHGSAYSHLALLDDLQPSFLKISHTFGHDVHEDETHRRIVSHLAAFSRDVGCRTVLEGVESEATARAAEELGVDLAQGYHYGRPASAAHWRSC